MKNIRDLLSFRVEHPEGGNAGTIGSSDRDQHYQRRRLPPDLRDAALILFYSVVVRIPGDGLFLAILPAFGLLPTFTAAAVAMSVTNLGLLVPSSPDSLNVSLFLLACAHDPRRRRNHGARVRRGRSPQVFYIPGDVVGRRVDALVWQRSALPPR